MLNSLLKKFLYNCCTVPQWAWPILAWVEWHLPTSSWRYPTRTIGQRSGACSFSLQPFTSSLNFLILVFLPFTTLPISFSRSPFYLSPCPSYSYICFTLLCFLFRSLKGTVRPDWICMRVVSLKSPLKGHLPLYVLNFLFLILNFWNNFKVLSRSMQKGL